MPVSLKFLDNGYGAVATAIGHLDGADAVEAVRKVNASDLTQTPVLYALFDFNSITALDFSTTQLHEAADIAVAAAKKKKNGRIVAVCAKQDLAFGLARMWKVFVDKTGWETMIFRDRSEAVAWIKARVEARFGRAVELE